MIIVHQPKPSLLLELNSNLADPKTRGLPVVGLWCIILNHGFFDRCLAGAINNQSTTGSRWIGAILGASFAKAKLFHHWFTDHRTTYQNGHERSVFLCSEA